MMAKTITGRKLPMPTKRVLAVLKKQSSLFKQKLEFA